jgi:hypothetical protein
MRIIQRGQPEGSLPVFSALLDLRSIPGPLVIGTKQHLLHITACQ